MPSLPELNEYAPEIEFPDWEEDQRVLEYSVDGVYLVGPRPAQYAAGEEVRRVSSLVKERLVPALEVFYPGKAQTMAELAEEALGHADEVACIRVAAEDDSSYEAMKNAYGALRDAVSALTSLEADDQYTEDTTEE